MSTAKPMSMERRTIVYYRQTGKGYLTPRQRRRWYEKFNRLKRAK